MADLKFASFEAMPAVYNDREMWVLYGDEWCKVGWHESTYAKPMSKQQFREEWGRQLPSLPPEAFKRET